MYKIIGADGKEYGPVSADDLRKWIAEGRLNVQSLARAENDAAFRPLSAFPEFAKAFAPAASPTPADFERRNYKLEIGGCVSSGWNLFKDHLGTLFGCFLLAILLFLAAGVILNIVLLTLIPKTCLPSLTFKLSFNVFFQAVLALVVGPLFGGIYYIFLQTMRRRPAGIGDMFIGFQRAFAQLFLGNFVVGFLVGLCFVPFNIIQSVKLEPVLEQLRHASPAEVHNIFLEFWSALFGTLPVMGICMIPMIYLAVNWQFTLPLIIDQQMDFWPAMKASWKMVHKHWWQVFGLNVVVGLINIAGLFACCVGVLFTVPMTTTALMYAYETIFGRSQTG